MLTQWSGLSCETFTAGSCSVQPQYVDGHSAAPLKQTAATVPAALLMMSASVKDDEKQEPSFNPIQHMQEMLHWNL